MLAIESLNWHNTIFQIWRCVTSLPLIGNRTFLGFFFANSHKFLDFEDKHLQRWQPLHYLAGDMRSLVVPHLNYASMQTVKHQRTTNPSI